MNSINKTARLAGTLYLLLLPLGIFGLILVQANLIVPGDAAATRAGAVKWRAPAPLPQWLL